VTETATATPTSTPTTTAAIAWLEDEFPGWTVSIDSTSSWDGQLRALWTARRDGHHPQAELSPAKLHSRLSDYHLRVARKQALAN
jgi:hypothetical protein